tara:strand:+ start:1217 stop:1882 length:666 start_codon:yes stop_codon:yes gene_type:complete
MKKLKNFVTSLHQQTKRNYIERMMNDKVNCTLIAKKYDREYWDGDRKYGYGGYKYIPGRWKPVAESLIENYKLKSGSKVLDVGCGKGFLLYEMKLLVPDLEIKGFDISKYGIENSHKEIKPNLFIHKAEDPFPYKDKEFDLVISLGCLHNLKIFETIKAIKEIERVGKQGYIMLESYRNENELFNLQCWALTCQSFLDHESWKWIYNYFGYNGDYEFIYFE